jgi:hypothetical protein
MTNGNDTATSTAFASARTPAQHAYARQLLLMDIHITWEGLRREELAALKGRDELVTLLVARYGLEKEAAWRDVDALLNGRTLTVDAA